MNCSKSAVAELMRCSRRTVGRILERVVNEQRLNVDLLAGLRSIGIDEISHRRGQMYRPLSLITSPDGWCGLLPAETAIRSFGSLTP